MSFRDLQCFVGVKLEKVKIWASSTHSRSLSSSLFLQGQKRHCSLR